VLTVNAAAEADGRLVVLGGGGADVITGTASLFGDSLSGGTGNDTFTMGANLSNLDTILGGAGIDTISVSGSNAGVDTAFTNVTQVEVLTDSAAATNVFGALALASGITTVNLFTGGVDSLTIGAGYTAAITVNQAATGEADVVSAAGSSSALNLVVSNAAGTGAGGTYTGGTSTGDVLTFNLSGGGITQAALATLTGFETVNVSNPGANTLSFTTDNATVASGAVLVVNASNMTAALTFNGSAETNGRFSVTGGSGADVITTGQGADTINAGAGTDTVTASANSRATVNLGDGADAITFVSSGQVTVTGGAGADTFNVVAKTLGGTSFDTITDASAGDILSFADVGTEVWFGGTAALAQVQLGSIAGFTDFLNAATAGTATNATNVGLAAGTGATNYITFSATATGNQPLTTNTLLTYNYTNNALTAGITGGTF
jgi:hypothetical protein